MYEFSKEERDDLKNYKKLHTIGEGSCLIHAILMSVSFLFMYHEFIFMFFEVIL